MGGTRGSLTGFLNEVPITGFTEFPAHEVPVTELTEFPAHEVPATEFTRFAARSSTRGSVHGAQVGGAGSPGRWQAEEGRAWVPDPMGYLMDDDHSAARLPSSAEALPRTIKQDVLLREETPSSSTAERRAKQARAIRRRKPWTRSTGPRTWAGKVDRQETRTASASGRCCGNSHAG